MINNCCLEPIYGASFHLHFTKPPPAVSWNFRIAVKRNYAFESNSDKNKLLPLPQSFQLQLTAIFTITIKSLFFCCFLSNKSHKENSICDPFDFYGIRIDNSHFLALVPLPPVLNAFCRHPGGSLSSTVVGRFVTIFTDVHDIAVRATLTIFVRGSTQCEASWLGERGSWQFVHKKKILKVS